MDAKFIAAVGGGFALILCARFGFSRSIRKAFATAANRTLIGAEIRGRHGSRALIWTQVLVIITFIVTFPLAHNRAAMLSLYFFILLACIAVRTIFQEIRIAAETELELRKQKESPSNPPLEPAPS